MLRVESSMITCLFALLIFISLAGCGPANSEPAAEKKEADKTAAVRTVPEAALNAGPSPAVDLNTELSQDAGPEEVCQRFLQCLQAGERRAAEKLLTQRALTATKRAELNLESPGGPQAAFTVAGVRYATSKRELATVDCRVVEELYGQRVESTVSWLLRSEAAGWRICGMILDLDEGGSLDFLSFENVADVERIKASVTESGQAEIVAENTPAETIRK